MIECPCGPHYTHYIDCSRDPCRHPQSCPVRKKRVPCPNQEEAPVIGDDDYTKKRIKLNETLRDARRQAQGLCNESPHGTMKRDMSIVITKIEEAILRNNACTVL